MSVHVYRPYKSWEEYRPFIDSAVAVFQSIFQPAGVGRLGLRYINDVTVAQQGGPINAFPNGVPQFPDSLSRLVTTNLIARLEGIDPQTEARVVQTLGRSPSEEGQLGLVPDINVIREWAEPRGVDDALADLESLRDLEHEVFEAAITDKLRSTFDD